MSGRHKSIRVLPMKIERLDPEANLDELVNLARIEYGDSEIANPEYLRWQYILNPAGKAIVVGARSDSGELAGQYVVIPLLFRIDGRIEKGSLSLNTLTHPDYRGRGLFTMMANETYSICKREGLSITLGFPNKSSYPGFVRKLEFKHIGNASVMFKVLSPVALLRSLLSIRGAEKYAPSRFENLELANPIISSSGFELRTISFEKHAESYDRMLRAQSVPRLSVYKHSEFCQWRFHDIPTRRYECFQALDAKGIQAACVVRLRKVRGVECVFVVDLQLSKGVVGYEAGCWMLKALLGWYGKAGLALGGMMVNSGSTAHRVARSSWFRELPSRFLPHNAPVIVRRNGEASAVSIFEVDAWDFAFGDYDVF